MLSFQCYGFQSSCCRISHFPLHRKVFCSINIACHLLVTAAQSQTLAERSHGDLTQLGGTRKPLQQQPPPKAGFPHMFSLLVQESENSQQTDLARALLSAEPLSAPSTETACGTDRAINYSEPKSSCHLGGWAGLDPLASLSACSRSCPFLTLNVVFPRWAARTRKPQRIADQTCTRSSFTQSLSHLKLNAQQSPCTHHANGPFANGPGKCWLK